MVTFCLLVAPLPYAIKKKLFSFLSESFIVAKIAYALKISFMSVPFIATLLRTLNIPHQLRSNSLRRCATAHVTRNRRGGPRKIITARRQD
jgi:hypothetical protein